jgi:transposase-like protein
MGKHKKYTTEFKLKAVEEYLSTEKSSDLIAKELDISSGKVVRRWISIYRELGEEGFISKRGKSSTKNGRPRKHFNSLEEENEYLRAKLALLESVLDLSVKKK